MNLYLNSLAKSIESLERVIKTANRLDASDANLQEAVRAGVIQNFEVVYDQSWKMMERWLEENVGPVYVGVRTRCELFRRAAESLIITDVDRWMEYHEARNRTSHTYDEDTAQSVFEEATEFFHDAKRLLRTLEGHND